MKPDILAVSKIDAEQRTYPSDPTALRDVAKIFPTIHHLISARLSIARRCNCRMNAIQLKENRGKFACCLRTSMRYSRVITVSMENAPGGMETLRLNLRDRTDVSLSTDKENRRQAPNPFRSDPIRSIHLVTVFRARTSHGPRARVPQSP